MFSIKDKGKYRGPQWGIGLLWGVVVITGCGGSGGDESTAGIVPDLGAEVIEESNDAPQSSPVETQSTALASHRAPVDFSFESYRMVEVTLELNAWAGHLNGNVYVVKLFDEEQTYFLGTRQALGTVKVAVLLPNHLSQLTLQVFTDQTDQTAVTKEIQL